jgi:catechol 2,3-dioxygenase-like lactoylglutathione lyase family enzyme
MSNHIFDHVDLRVSNVARARSFYDAFLPAVGFTCVRGGDDWASYAVDGDHRKSTPFVWLNEEPGYRGGSNRIAFWADTEEEVNRLGAIVQAAGGQAVEGPEYCADYTPGYYAVFFEDLDGNKWEICCRDARVRSNAGDSSAA